MSLRNKLITLTGAASGIGLATARILARRGALLSLADYNSQALKSAHEELSSLSSAEKVISTSLDIRSSSAVNSWIRDTKQHFGRPIDGCANVAGFHPVWTPKNVEDITDDEFDQVIAINTTGLFRCLRAQLSPGILSSPASIVNVGSVSGLIGFSGDAAYVASKHAAHGLTKCAAKEAGPRGVRVNVVAPGQTDTPMVRAMQEVNGVLPAPNVPLGRDAKPEEVAEVIVWLLGEESSYVTGSAYRVDGGMLE